MARRGRLSGSLGRSFRCISYISGTATLIPSAHPRRRGIGSDLMDWRRVEEIAGVVQHLPVPSSSEYPAFRRAHWAMGRPSVR